MSARVFALAGVHRRTLASIGCAVLPDTGLCPMDTVIDHVELSIGALPRPVRAALIAGLIAYNQGARAMPSSLGRSAASLPKHKARSYFHSWWHGPTGVMREFARGIKGLLALGYYEQPEVMAAIGYTPHEWIEKVQARRLALYRDDVERAEARVFEPDPLPIWSESESESDSESDSESESESESARESVA